MTWKCNSLSTCNVCLTSLSPPQRTMWCISILLWPETGNPTRTPLAVKTNKNKACWQRGRNSFITKVGVFVWASAAFWLEEIIFCQRSECASTLDPQASLLPVVSIITLNHLKSGCRDVKKCGDVYRSSRGNHDSRGSQTEVTSQLFLYIAKLGSCQNSLKSANAQICDAIVSSF